MRTRSSTYEEISSYIELLFFTCAFMNTCGASISHTKHDRNSFCPCSDSLINTCMCLFPRTSWREAWDELRCARVEPMPMHGQCCIFLSIVTNANRRCMVYGNQMHVCWRILMESLIYEGFPHEGFQSISKIHVFMRDSLIHGGRRRSGSG